MQVAIISAATESGQLAAQLLAVGIQAQECRSLADMSELMQLFTFDLVLIDTASAKGPEHAVQALRAVHGTVPVMVFGCRPDREQSLACFAAGADDVVAWPGDTEMIAAKIRVIVCRGRGADAPVLCIGSLCFDVIRRSLNVDGQALTLTSKEYDVLEYMVTRKNRVLTKEALLNQLYGCKDAPDGRIIDVFVCKLRKKLAMSGIHDLIETSRGFGYMLNEHTCRFVRPVPAYSALSSVAA